MAVAEASQVGFLDLSYRSGPLKRDGDGASHPPQDGLDQSEL